MPGSTVPFGLPYPTAGDPLDVPGDVQALAEATDALMLSTLASASAAGMTPSVVVRGGPQSLLTGVSTVLAFNEIVFDNAGYSTDITLTGRIATLTPAALYMVQGIVAWGPNVTGSRRCTVFDDNNPAPIASAWVPGSSDASTGVTPIAASIFQPGAFSTVGLSGVQNSGTTLSILGCELAIYRIAP